MTITKMLQVADELASSSPGYDQYDRWEHLNRSLKQIVKRKDCDCSSSCGTIAWLGGYPVDLTGTFYTGNFAQKMKASGHFKVIDCSGWSRTKLLAYLRKGDFLLGPGHVVFVRSATKWWSAEYDERGRSNSGKDGFQSGERVGYRSPYMRSKGWTRIIRPYTVQEFEGRVLACYEDGDKAGLALSLKRLKVSAPYDGPLWAAFMAAWATLDKGMDLAYTVDELTGVAASSHAFVVLGSALKADGTMPSKLVKRLQLVLTGLQRFPASKVLVTGGKPENGITEAAAMRAWLIEKGIADDRIIVEAKATSTIGNALASVPLLVKAKVTSYTLVSAASHLRRAQVEFLAAQLKMETAANKRLPLVALQAFAVDDYTPAGKPIATENPVTSATRSAIVKEVAYLLDVMAEYNKVK